MTGPRKVLRPRALTPCVPGLRSHQHPLWAWGLARRLLHLEAAAEPGPPSPRVPSVPTVPSPWGFFAARGSLSASGKWHRARGRQPLPRCSSWLCDVPCKHAHKHACGSHTATRARPEGSAREGRAVERRAWCLKYAERGRRYPGALETAGWCCASRPRVKLPRAARRQQRCEFTKAV